MVSVRLAQVLSTPEFGRVSIVVVLQFLLISAARSWAVDPMARLLRGSPNPGDRLVPAGFGRSVLVTSTLTGVVTAALCVGLAVPFPLLVAFVVLGISATGHDSMRAALLINHSPRACVVGDATWLVIQVAVFVCAAALDRSSAAVAVAAACLGATGATVPLALALRQLRRTAAVGASSSERLYWLGEQLLGGGVLPLATVALAVSAGYAASAAFRGALLLMGPATVMVAALRQPALGWLSRMPKREVHRRTRGLAVAVAFAATGLTVPILFVPENLGQLLLGEVWAPASAVLPAVIVQRVAGSAAEAFLVTNRGFGEPRYALLSRTALVGAVLVCALVVGRYGTEPAVWSIAVLSVVWLLVADKVAVAERPRVRAGDLVH